MRFVADLDATTWDEIVSSSGVSRDLIRQAAEIAATSERMITCWAMGITQHSNGVANVQTIVNFNLLRGQIGRPGAGVCPVRGHSNVQGDRTVGIWEQMSDRVPRRAGKGIQLRPAATRTATTPSPACRRCTRARSKSSSASAATSSRAGPDTEYTAEAFRRSRL